MTILDGTILGETILGETIFDGVLDTYGAIRAGTEKICAPLETEDYVVQPHPQVSPPKWHLAHTTWFFETFILDAFDPDHMPFDPLFSRLFNSYYKSQGRHWRQEARGDLSRPTVNEVYRYRRQVDDRLRTFLATSSFAPETAARLAAILETGLHHEQQHQELLIMDIKYILGQTPLRPAYAPAAPETAKEAAQEPPAERFIALAGGLAEIGRDPADGFAFCNETPRHRVFLEDFLLQNRPVSNGDYLAFLEDGGYDDPLLWKSDGWDHLCQTGERHPLYWYREDGEWREYTLQGPRPLRLNAPLSHISFYEADAYACWAGARLPTEFEWEYAAAAAVPAQADLPAAGFLEDGRLETAYDATPRNGFYNLHGTAWEWTSSAYLPYPRYRRPAGAFGEYNSKFMINQKVLRGGCYATPGAQYRPSYRNFFFPHQNWAVTGLRLAKDPPC